MSVWAAKNANINISKQLTVMKVTCLTSFNNRFNLLIPKEKVRSQTY